MIQETISLVAVLLLCAGSATATALFYEMRLSRDRLRARLREIEASASEAARLRVRADNIDHAASLLAMTLPSKTVTHITGDPGPAAAPGVWTDRKAALDLWLSKAAAGEERIDHVTNTRAVFESVVWTEDGDERAET